MEGDLSLKIFVLGVEQFLNVSAASFQTVRQGEGLNYDDRCKIFRLWNEASDSGGSRISLRSPYGAVRLASSHPSHR